MNVVFFAMGCFMIVVVLMSNICSTLEPYVNSLFGISFFSPFAPEKTPQQQFNLDVTTITLGLFVIGISKVS